MGDPPKRRPSGEYLRAPITEVRRHSEADDGVLKRQTEDLIAAFNAALDIRAAERKKLQRDIYEQHVKDLQNTLTRTDLRLKRRTREMWASIAVAVLTTVAAAAYTAAGKILSDDVEKKVDSRTQEVAREAAKPIEEAATKVERSTSKLDATLEQRLADQDRRIDALLQRLEAADEIDTKQDPRRR